MIFVYSKLTVSESVCRSIVKNESNMGILMNSLMTHAKKQVSISLLRI